MKALLRALAALRRLRPSRWAERLRSGALADGVLPDAVATRLGARGSESGSGLVAPVEAELPEVVADTAQSPIQHAVLVGVPIEIAYNQFTQFEDFPHFMRGVVHAQQRDPAQVELRFRAWGVRRSWRAHIVDQRPEERIAWRSAAGAKLAGVTTFHSVADRLTRIDVNVVVEPAGAVQRIARRLGLLDRAVARELRRFKAFIEMREEETGAWRGYIADGEVVEEDDYFGWEPGEGHADEETAAQPASSSDSASGDGARAKSSPASSSRTATKKRTGAKKATAQPAASNGASAGTSKSKSSGSAKGRNRSGKRTGGSRAKA
jgi:uncharacterized membrane protein